MPRTPAADARNWTADMVLAVLGGGETDRLALLAFAARHLGTRSLGYRALVARARLTGRPSVSEACRERMGWPRSRAALYRWSRAAAADLAAALAASGEAPRALRQDR